MQLLKTGEAYMNFKGTLRSRATEKQYLWLINRYAVYRKMFDLDQIIDADSKSSKLAVAPIREFLLSLEARNLSAASMHNYKTALKHFYEMNGVPLNWKKINRFGTMEDVAAGIREKYRAYSHREIQQMLGHALPKYKALILLLASSGIRVGAIKTILLKHLTKMEVDDTTATAYQLLIYPGHSEQYITFCSPEATEAIDYCLSMRTRVGERLGPLSPLFRTDFYAQGLFKVRNNVIPLNVLAIQKTLQNILKAAALLPSETTTESGNRRLNSIRHEVQLCHGFRKLVIGK